MHKHTGLSAALPEIPAHIQEVPGICKAGPKQKQKQWMQLEGTLECGGRKKYDKKNLPLTSSEK